MAHNIHYLTIFVCIVKFLKGPKCTNEEKCNCTKLPNFKELFHMDCSNKGLTEMPIPSIDFEVYSIDLSQNKLRNVLITENYSRTLKQLNLSHNALRNLSNNSFNWIPYLEVLDLSYNNLTLSNTRLPNLVFQYLSNLKVLNLSHNDVIGTDHYNAEVFRHTESLETLVIDGLRNGNFDFTKHDKRCDRPHKDTSIYLKKLTTLVVSGRRERKKCLVKHLSADFFQSVFNLKYLDMSVCAIQSVDKKSLLLSELQYLDLSYNEHLSFKSFQNLSIPQTLKTLKLDKICCTFGIGTYITQDMAELFWKSSVEYLSLKSNRLETAVSNGFNYLPQNLTRLDVSDNRLTFGAYGFPIPFLKKLQVVNMQNQFYPHFNERYNNLEECKEGFVCSSRPDGNNSTSGWNFASYHSKDFVFYAPPSLETINYSNSSLNTVIRQINVDPNNNVKNVVLSHNFFETLEGPIYGLHKIEKVDFSHNYISYLSPVFFGNGSTLKNLILKNNLLGNCMSKPNLTYFGNLWNLTLLDLSSNIIRFAAPDIFEGLESLRILNLSFNLLRNVSFRMHQMPSLRTLDLSFNALLPFSDSTIQILESRQQTRQLEIILSGNEFQCTCDSLNFLKWMLRNKNTVIVDYSYLCRNMYHAIDNNDELDMVSKMLDKKCDDYKEIIGIVSGLFIVFFAFIIGGIIHRYRWKLRYFYYMSKWSATISHISYGRVYDYDVFVSYADEEKDFVIQEMTSELEEASDLKLCLHERDFTLGLSIGENITKAICNSRKVLCVVTENFLCSQWCMYELEMALTDNRYSRVDQSVFLIMYGGLPTDSCKIRSSKQLTSLVKKHAYLEYPNDESGRAEFWNSLKIKLGE
ncbi:toll-like receptor 4 [Crassostrea angulata]|uniref:toll-like receptor 4 n=1 Tax=Magallana angulata TaxID=2784310 RepID=UPI0022B1B00E|nr:toll-like receptor 4 [Crassostrea angulata]XP_052678830.1 toll-like receptor 4 [Crassostrea angulata]XP_052678837.1 toll-like receptor 4 [Crassostrea angulata]